MAARKPKKPKAEPLLDGDEEVWQLVKEKWPAKYLELKIKKAALQATLKTPNPLDPTNAQSMLEIGKLLLQSVGLSEPSDEQIGQAVAVNDQFIKDLEDIAGIDNKPKKKAQAGDGYSWSVDEGAATLRDLGH